MCGTAVPRDNKNILTNIVMLKHLYMCRGMNAIQLDFSLEILTFFLQSNMLLLHALYEIVTGNKFQNTFVRRLFVLYVHD